MTAAAAAGSASGTVSVGSSVTSAMAQLDALGLDRLVHRLELAGVGQDLVAFRLGLEILRAGLQRHLHQLVLAGRLARDDDLALAMEQAGDRAAGGHGAAVLGQQAADFRRGAVAVVGAQLHQHRHAVRAEDLVGQLLVTDRVVPARCPA